MELENALLELTDRLPALGLPTDLNSSDDLDKLIPHIKSAIDGARLWEYYVFDVQASVKAVASSLDAKSVKTWIGENVQDKSTEELAQIVKRTDCMMRGYRAYASRYCTRVDSEVAAGFIQVAYPSENSVNLASRWGQILDVINVDLYAECEDDLKAALDGVIGRLRYTRVEEGGPKMGEINKK